MGTNILDGASLGDSNSDETAAEIKSVEDADGFVLGAFCLMDAAPRRWNRTDVMAVATLARAASTAVALRRMS